MTDKQAIIERMAEIAYTHKVSDGFDRNGSHDAGEYLEYEWSLSDVIREEDMWKVEAAIGAALDASGLWSDTPNITEVNFIGNQYFDLSNEDDIRKALKAINLPDHPPSDT